MRSSIFRSAIPMSNRRPRCSMRCGALWPANRPGSHGYMPNPGYPQVREAVARKLRRETGLAFTAEDVFMTVGSAGACNVILKSILDPGDEVIVLMPCFSEYQFYIANHGGCMVPVETDASFLPDVERIAAAITPRTRAMILNTPNNPTGRVYPESVLRDLQTASGARRPAHHRHQRRAVQVVTSLTGSSSPRWRRSSPIRRSATRGPSRWDCPASASATWRSRRNSTMPQICAAPAPSAIAFWALSTRLRSGSG